MCSILGGSSLDDQTFKLYQLAKDRGRDFSGLCQYAGSFLANHRATPTNEQETGVENQPFGREFKVVHNGTIANDEELGNTSGEIDSKVLGGILDPTDLNTFTESVQRVEGSYAIALMTKRGEFFLACNYKPIFIVHYYDQRGEEQVAFSSLEHHLKHLGNPYRMKPYSTMHIWGDPNGIHMTANTLPREQVNRAIVVCSGGLDSTAVTGYAKQKHDEIILLHFDYGCRATDQEKRAIEKIANFLECPFRIIPIDYSPMKGDSTLFGCDQIETGKAGVEYALDWVPARNLVLLSYAVAFAEANGYGYIYLGNNLEEGGAYPDNEQQWITDLSNTLYGAVQNGVKVEIKQPLGNLMKREIVEFGKRVGSPLHLSYSCYNGGKDHCGKCGPCYMRKEAFKRAGIPDPTSYES